MCNPPLFCLFPAFGLARTVHTRTRFPSLSCMLSLALPLRFPLSRARSLTHTLSLFSSLSPPLCLSLSLSLALARSRSRTRAVSLSLPPSCYLFPSVCLALSHVRWLSLSFARTRALSLFRSLSLSPSPPPSPSLSFSHSHSFYFSFSCLFFCLFSLSLLLSHPPLFLPMGWLRSVGTLKLQVSFAKDPYERDYILQKRPIILRSLLIEATPYYLTLSRLPSFYFALALCFSPIPFLTHRYPFTADQCRY